MESENKEEIKLKPKYYTEKQKKHMQTYIEKNKDKYKQYLSDYYKKDMNRIKKKLRKEVWRGIIR